MTLRNMIVGNMSLKTKGKAFVQALNSALSPSSIASAKGGKSTKKGKVKSKGK